MSRCQEKKSVRSNEPKTKGVVGNSAKKEPITSVRSGNFRVLFPMLVDWAKTSPEKLSEALKMDGFLETPERLFLLALMKKYASRYSENSDLDRKKACELLVDAVRSGFSPKLAANTFLEGSDGIEFMDLPSMLLNVLLDRKTECDSDGELSAIASLIGFTVMELNRSSFRN